MALFPLQVAGAEVRRKGKVLIGPVDLRLEETGITIVLGPNGAGKTTFLQMLSGTTRLSDGEVKWSCPTDVARKKQAFVFQKPVMLRRSVRENLSYPLRLVKTPRNEAIARADRWAERVGLQEVLSRQATSLSWGERQKLALARALIREPEVLFLDEPCASLDGRAIREIEEILQNAAAAGTRLIMSTHDLGQARRLADEIAFIYRGKVHEFEACPTFFQGPKSAQAGAFLRGDILE
jgi:tungstate transport system ATP-binding protein